MLTLTVAVSTFLLRWLTLDFDNDYFMHMAWAAEMLRGQWPVRDFVEPGFPLQTWLAYAGLRLGGYQFSWEGFIACAFIAASTALIYSICRRLGVPRWLSLLVVLIAAADVSAAVQLPEGVRLSGGNLGAPRYQHRPEPSFASPRRARHGDRLSLSPRSRRVDRGARRSSASRYCHWREPKVLARTVVAYGIASLALVSPWLDLGRSLRTRRSILELSVGTVRRTHRPRPLASLRSSSSTSRLQSSSIAPLSTRSSAFDGPERVPRHAAFARRTLSSPAAGGRTRTISFDEPRLGQHQDAALAIPPSKTRAASTEARLRIPDGAFPWLYLQLQRYVPLIRLRVLPGFVKTANAEPWLTDVTFFIPWFVLTVELLRMVDPRGRTPTASASALIIPTAVLSIITYQTLVRASPDSRLGDIAALTAVLLAWGVWRLWTLNGVSEVRRAPIGRRRRSCSRSRAQSPMGA